MCIITSENVFKYFFIGDEVSILCTEIDFKLTNYFINKLAKAKQREAGHERKNYFYQLSLQW